MGTEGLTNHVLISTERKVTKEQGIRRRVGGVAELSSTVVGTLLWGIVVTRGGEVDIGLTSIDQCALLGLESSGAVGGVVEIDISEALGATSCLVRDDTSARDLSELLELTVQPLIINVPAQVTDKQVGGSGLSDSLDLRLLCGGSGVFLSLALLGWCFFLIFARVLRIVGVICVLFITAGGGVGAVLIFIFILTVGRLE